MRLFICLNIISNGYFIPFKEIPPKFYAHNNASSRKHTEFVENTIKELLENRCIKELQEMPYCCNPLSVAEGEKLRLVIDLRHVNKYIKINKFRYEDLRTFAEIFEQGEFFTTFDLTSGYHHVEIHPEHYKFVGFSWTQSTCKTKYYVYAVLPFGLSPACYVFTKMLRPLVKKWRSSGIRSIIYIGDGIASGDTFEQALKHAAIVRLKI